MSKILFIGGPADRQYHEVADGKDYHTIPLLGPLRNLTVESNARRPFRPHGINLVVYKRQHFVASTSATNHDTRNVKKFEYFAPQNLSPAEVVTILLESYSWGIIEEEEDDSDTRIEFDNGSEFQFRDSDEFHRSEEFGETGSMTPSCTPSEEPSESFSYSASASCSPSPSASPSAEPTDWEEIPFKLSNPIIEKIMRKLERDLWTAMQTPTWLL